MAFSTRMKGHHHLQGNVQVYSVRIPVEGALFVVFSPLFGDPRKWAAFLSRKDPEQLVEPSGGWFGSLVSWKRLPTTLQMSASDSRPRPQKTLSTPLILGLSCRGNLPCRGNGIDSPSVHFVVDIQHTPVFLGACGESICDL